MPTLPTGRLTTPPEVLAHYRVSLANASGLANYHASLAPVMRTGQGLTGTVQNGSGAIATYGTSGLRDFGNLNFENCITAALGYHKLLVTTATGATPLYLPEGGSPDGTTDTQWGSGLASDVPANEPGVIAWSQVNGCLNFSYIATVLGKMAAAGSWPNGGMVHTGGTHHPIGSYGAIAATNQTEIQLALTYFKTVLFGLSGDAMLSQWSGGSRFFHGISANGDDNHCFCACDCGPASTLATQYGVSVPGGMDPGTFCLGGCTWGCFALIDWTSLCNIASEAWVIITDPDRGDASTFTPVAQADYRSMCGTNGPFLAAALSSYRW